MVGSQAWTQIPAPTSPPCRALTPLSLYFLLCKMERTVVLSLKTCPEAQMSQCMQSTWHQAWHGVTAL